MHAQVEINHESFKTKLNASLKGGSNSIYLFSCFYASFLLRVYLYVRLVVCSLWSLASDSTSKYGLISPVITEIPETE